MSRITPKILIGGNREAQNGRWLQSLGVTHIVNAAKELPNYFPQNFNYLRLDLNDTPDQDLSRALNNSYSFMKKAIDGGGVVFVHCMVGMSRSSSQIIHYLMLNYLISFDEALAYVRKKHPLTNPNAGFKVQLSLRDPTRRRQNVINSDRYSRHNDYYNPQQNSWWDLW